jgi:hypothetical protein
LLKLLIGNIFLQLVHFLVINSTAGGAAVVAAITADEAVDVVVVVVVVLVVFVVVVVAVEVIVVILLSQSFRICSIFLCLHNFANCNKLLTLVTSLVDNFLNSLLSCTNKFDIHLSGMMNFLSLFSQNI